MTFEEDVEEGSRKTVHFNLFCGDNRTNDGTHQLVNDNKNCAGFMDTILENQCNANEFVLGDCIASAKEDNTGNNSVTKEDCPLLDKDDKTRIDNMTVKTELFNTPSEKVEGTEPNKLGDEENKEGAKPILDENTNNEKTNLLSPVDLARDILDEICDKVFDQICDVTTNCENSRRPDGCDTILNICDLSDAPTKLSSAKTIVRGSAFSVADDELSDCDCADCAKETKLKIVITHAGEVRKKKRNSLDVEKRVSFCIDQQNQSTPKKYTSKSLPDLLYLTCGDNSLVRKDSQLEVNNNRNKQLDEQSSTDTIEDVTKFRECINKKVNYFTENDEENNNLSSSRKNLYRRSHIYEDNIMLPVDYLDASRNRDSLYSVEEYEEEKHENFVDTVNDSLINYYSGNEDEYEIIPDDIIYEEGYEHESTKHQDSTSKSNNTKEKKKKKSFFGSFLKKSKDTDSKDKDKHKDKDLKKSSKSLAKSRKYSSAFDVSDKSSLSRTPSLIKKLSRVTSDASLKLKRSFSYRDVNKTKSEKDHCLAPVLDKNAEWAKSLQNLIESDVSVSYNDLSFINYDAFNTVTYNPIKNNLHRTQSLNVKGSQDGRNANFSRGTSVPHDFQSTSTLSIDSGGAVSLPSLHHIGPENAETATDSSPKHLYRRRPQSINSDEGRPRQRGNGSFRSAGSGCAKLKRNNACRQKSRENLSLAQDALQKREATTVRSRSLNHLDTLEMRQGTPVSNDALKDARSEPDCSHAQPLLTLPGVSSESTTPTTERPAARRNMLSRSQKSSSECFSVNFEVGDESTWDNELFFPASRGATLYDSLSKLCELRSIDLSSCDIWLQDKDNNYSTLLTLYQDTANLVGRHIRITPKEKRIGHSRKLSENFRPLTSGSFFSSSTEDPTANLVQELDSSKKSTRQRWTVFWGKDPQQSTRIDLLVEQLNSYSKVNFAEKSKIYPLGQCESIDALYMLEDDWRNIIDASKLTEKQQQQQTALWELIKTESAYIKNLKVVIDLFVACLKALQSAHLLKEIDNDKLFSNIMEILDANVMFWRNSLFPLVRDMRKYKEPACLEIMCEGFQNIRQTFLPYFKFCADQARCQHYCREKHRTNSSFTAYLAWCETQKDCNRLKLLDILVQPMQRLTKYGLLLKAILKHTEDEIEISSLNAMVKSVDEFVNEVNHSLKHKQENERLNGIIARIESYDVVESKDDDLDKLLKTYSHFDLTKPMLNCHPDRKRHLLLEGDLKLKDSNSSSKMEVHCFLLTDMLLICKPSNKKGVGTLKVIRQPYLVDRLVVHELNKETPSLAVIYRNEFDMAVCAFILQNSDPKKLKAWKDNISKAQALYREAKQSVYMTEESIEADYNIDYNYESEIHSLKMPPRSPMATSSRASRVSSLAHSHSGSVEMNDQSSIGSAKEPSRAVSVENENRTASISSDEGVQPLPPDRSPVSQKNSFKHRLFNKTPNTLSVQPFGNLGQSLPNLTLGSPNVGTLSLNLNQNTLSVPSAKNGGHLLSPTHRGISYPPPSPTRGNLRRGLAITQSKNPPLIKTRHVTSTTTNAATNPPNSFDFDVPVIAGVSSNEGCENFSRSHHRQAMCKRIRNDNKRYHTAGVVDDIKRNDNRDASIHKRLSWNYSNPTPQNQPDDQT